MAVWKQGMEMSIYGLFRVPALVIGNMEMQVTTCLVPATMQCMGDAAVVQKKIAMMEQQIGIMRFTAVNFIGIIDRYGRTNIVRIEINKLTATTLQLN